MLTTEILRTQISRNVRTGIFTDLLEAAAGAKGGLVEIRLHGRGGQGGLSCAKLLATIYAQLGKTVQVFGDFAGEGSGAPVLAYARISDGVITNRNRVYEPDHVLALDESLLDAAVSGLKPGGLLLINTASPPETFSARYPRARLATVDATEIARRHGIGGRVVIVNTTLAGAFARAVDLPVSALEAACGKLGFTREFSAVLEAWEGVQTAEPGATDSVAVPRESTCTGRSQTPHHLERLAPCNAACPAGNDVVGFTQALATRGVEAAARVLGRTTPFAGVCGRVCPGPCMTGCNRSHYDGAVDTRGIERYIAENAIVACEAEVKSTEPRRIAVVGGGPAGLSAAYALARVGHQVVIYEGGHQLGGALRTGTPPFRLPREVLDAEISSILALGVKARCDQRMSASEVAELVSAYDGVVVATGLQDLHELVVEGSQLQGVMQGVHFLAAMNSGEQRNIKGQVVVLGGGGTAIDCARTAIRAGADSVTVAYRRTRAEMPAVAEDVKDALDEGVVMLFQRSPVSFFGHEVVEGLELAEVALGEPDDRGKREPIVTDQTEVLECDAVLMALGQSAESGALPKGWSVGESGQISAGDRLLPAFCAGDLSTGEGTVAHGIGDGRLAAERLLVALGAGLRVDANDNEVVGVEDLRFEHFEPSPPSALNREEAQARATDFREVNQGLFDPDEARRCISCGTCNYCDHCLVFCPEGGIERQDSSYRVDLNRCKGCGICANECPRGVIAMVIP